MAFHSEGNILVSGSYDSTVRFWDLRSSSNTSCIQVLREARDSISSIKVHDCQILCGSVDGCIRLYDVRAGQMIQDSITFPITHVSFSSDKNCILASSLDGTIRLLDKDSGELLNDYSGHCNNQYKISSCLDNTDAYVLSGSEDNLIYVWDLVDAKILAKIPGHGNVVTSISYHPKQLEFVSASVDGTIRIWRR